MNIQFLLVFVKEFIVPELMQYIERKSQAGQVITKEELNAEVDRIADKIISEGQAFLNRPQ